MPTHAFQDCFFQCPYPHSRQLTTRASIGDLQTLTRQVWLSLSWGHCSFPLGPGMHKIFLCVCPPGVCFLESCGSSVIKSHYPSKSDSHFNSVSQLCQTLWDPMDCSTPGFPVHHQLTEITQNHVHGVGDAIQPSLSSPFSSGLQSFPAPGSCQRSQFFTSGGQSIGISALTSILPMNIQD